MAFKQLHNYGTGIFIEMSTFRTSTLKATFDQNRQKRFEKNRNFEVL